VRRALRIAGLALAGGVLLAAAFHTQALTALGAYLERDSPPSKADVAYVLAGDAYGHRILKAADLVRQGYAPQAVISGPPGYYGFHECDLAIPFAVKAGYPASFFLAFPNEAHSTREESQAAAAEFHKLGVRRVLLITSIYHTRRAGTLFRAAAPEIEFIVVGAPDEHFRVSDWWRDREGRKTFLTEWLKTAAGWFNL
jgi:uncharacterized SAM-binding protein YcdF (DUF218 family)